MSFDEETTKTCGLLCEQYDPQGFPQREVLPKECFTLKFPSVDFSLLWPFNCINAYNKPEPPAFPFGRFPYGDRAITNAIDRGMSADDILDYYMNSWEDYRVDLDRLLQLETARIQARDAKCDVKIGDFVLTRFRKERLFWTVNHPAPVLLSELIERLLHAADPVDPALQDADIESTVAAHFPNGGPLGVVNVPIHPKVAEYLQLEWYDPNEIYRTWDGATYTYRQYFEEMIRHAFRMRAEGAVPTLAQ